MTFTLYGLATALDRTGTVPFCTPDVSFAARREGLVLCWHSFLDRATPRTLPCRSSTEISVVTTQEVGLGFSLRFSQFFTSKPPRS